MKNEKKIKILILATIFIIFALGCLDLPRWETKEKVKTFPLHQLYGMKEKKIEGNLSGGFLLIAGGIEGKIRENKELLITYLVEYKHGLQAKTIEWGDNIYINEIENTNIKPHLKIIYELTFRITNRDYSNEIRQIWNKRIIRKVFYIPKGTIVNNYSINIK